MENEAVGLKSDAIYKNYKTQKTLCELNKYNVSPQMIKQAVKAIRESGRLKIQSDIHDGLLAAQILVAALRAEWR